MKKGRIYIPGKTYEKKNKPERPVIRISVDAYNALVDVLENTNLSLSQVASMIIIQGSELVVYEREGSDDLSEQ